MSDADVARQLERLNADADKRERAAADRHTALVKAVTAGFASIAKELHDGFTLIQHTVIDELRRR